MATTAVKAGPPKKVNWYATGGLGLGGGALGFLAGPVGAVAGLIVGSVTGYFFGAKVAAMVPASALQSVLHAVQGGPVAPTAPQQTVAQQVASTGIAKPAATALYAYLKAHGPDGTSDLAQLVGAFQSAANSDPTSLQLTGPLPISAVYDPKTSAALSMYTSDPIPPATPPAPQPPPTPAQVADVFLPGAAATSATNLYMYLKAHSPHSPTDGSLNKLVHQFQIDVNTDPKFPGPAAVVGQGILMKLVTTPLPETGAYDAATAKALSYGTGEYIAP